MNKNRNTPKQFYRHLIIYIIVNLMLFVLDVLDGGGWWFYFPLIGWGILVVIQALRTFVFEG